SDLEKMIGYAQKPQFYSLQTSNRLAFNALSSSVASVAIPLGFFAPQTDTYTISLNTEDVQNLEGVYLTDKTTGAVTNLLFDDYNFSSARALNDNRFSVAIVRAVTSVDNLLAEDSVAPFVHNRDLWINNAPIGSVLYVFDMLGREVISEQINKETLVYHLHMAGVYHVQIVSKDKKSVYKVVSY
ncbi:MAG: T9SS type A sorting domain-containing protein, partial [Paludibacteraceae bacterium]|nr:T9SS type A sorting domain-containing protein [Paludibacteraceae bacterium]